MNKEKNLFGSLELTRNFKNKFQNSLFRKKFFPQKKS